MLGGLLVAQPSWFRGFSPIDLFVLLVAWLILCGVVLIGSILPALLMSRVAEWFNLSSILFFIAWSVLFALALEWLVEAAVDFAWRLASEYRSNTSVWDLMRGARPIVACGGVSGGSTYWALAESPPRLETQVSRDE